MYKFVLRSSCLMIAFFIVILGSSIAQQSANNDEFSASGNLANWSNVTAEYTAEHFEVLDINTTTPGRLTLQPYTSAWFAQFRGGFLYKSITGDFVFTTEVSAATTGASTYSLGGLFLRAPNPGADNGDHNYVFLSTGYADPSHASCPAPCNAPHLEVKNTVNSGSALRVASVPAGSVTIRIARLGTTIVCLYRPAGAVNFIVHQRYNRSDFPAEIQAGFVAYTDWPKVQTYTEAFHNTHVLNSSLVPDPSSDAMRPFTPDITATFDYARYDDVTVPMGLNPATATEGELLAFLGYEPDSFLPVEWGTFRSRVDKQDVELSWSTHSLINHDHFIVEHSLDGIGYRAVGELWEQGESIDAESFFSWRHKDVSSGLHYYRILQVDTDGTASNSPVQQIFMDADDILISPNPLIGVVRIQGQDIESIEIRDVRGILVREIDAPAEWIDLSQLPAGTYVLAARSKQNQISRKKLVKM